MNDSGNYNRSKVVDLPLKSEFTRIGTAYRENSHRKSSYPFLVKKEMSIWPYAGNSGESDVTMV